MPPGCCPTNHSGDRALEQPASLTHQGTKDFPWSWAPHVTLPLLCPWIFPGSGLFVKYLGSFGKLWAGDQPQTDDMLSYSPWKTWLRPNLGMSVWWAMKSSRKLVRW